MNTFNHRVDGKDRPARRVTIGALGMNHGRDRRRALIVSLESGDLIVFRPKGTRQRLMLSAFDAYGYAVRCQALAKAREKRQAKAASKRGAS